MEISTNISYLKKRRGSTERRDILESAKILKDAGFKYIDFFVEDWYIDGDDYKERLEKLRNEFEKLGIIVDQTHAPYVDYARKVGLGSRDRKSFRQQARTSHRIYLVCRGADRDNRQIQRPYRHRLPGFRTRKGLLR